VRYGCDSGGGGGGGGGVDGVWGQMYLNLRHVWEKRARVGFQLFFYSARSQGIRVYGNCRARGIANILLIISSFLVCSPMPSPGPLIV
jgi:hypothetical protein